MSLARAIRGSRVPSTNTITRSSITLSLAHPLVTKNHTLSATKNRDNRPHANAIPWSFSNTSRSISSSSTRFDVPSWPPPPMPQPAVNPSPPQPSSSNQSYDWHSDGRPKKGDLMRKWMESPFVQAGVTTVVGLIMVFAGGVGYLTWYKAHVLNKMEAAFAPGYDPALELGTIRNKRHSKTSDGEEKEEGHIIRKEQALVDEIVHGTEVGSYWLIVGSKGTGKGTMIIDAMRAISAEGAAFCEAHPDLEVFRLRLGKALHYEFNEDWQGSLFSRRDPREGGPALDIERAMNKLEKVALRYARKKGRPLLLAFNNVHLFPNNDEGHALIRQLQQRAEAWSEAGICTMVFSTDDFWCLDAMKKNASRMQVLSVYDLPPAEALRSLRYLRRAHWESVGRSDVLDSEEEFKSVLTLLGGRTSFLTRVSRAEDMVQEAKDMVQREKAWLLSKIGLIPDHDDDVMDEQKWASCSWLLLREFVRQFEKAKEELEVKQKEGEVGLDPLQVKFPPLSYYRARQVMTRTDFLDPLDHANIISIDVNHNVRPDSMLLYNAAKEVVDEEGFDDMLDAVRDRVDEIEGLHRQNELTVKEPFKVRIGGGWFGRQRTIEVEGLGASFIPASND